MSVPGDTDFNSGRSLFGGNLTIAVLNGTVPEWRLDDMVTRIMAAYIFVGQDPETFPETNFNSWTTDEYVRDDHSKIIREVDLRACRKVNKRKNRIGLYT